MQYREEIATTILEYRYLEDTTEIEADYVDALEEVSHYVAHYGPVEIEYSYKIA